MVLTRTKYRYDASGIADDLFPQMCNTYEGLNELFGPDKYLLRTIDYARNVLMGRFDYEYVIDKSDLTCQLRALIERLAIEDPMLLDDIICDVISRSSVSKEHALELVYSICIRGCKLRWR